MTFIIAILGLAILGILLVLLGISLWQIPEILPSDTASPTVGDRKSRRYAK